MPRQKRHLFTMEERQNKSPAELKQHDDEIAAIAHKTHHKEIRQRYTSYLDEVHKQHIA